MIPLGLSLPVDYLFGATDSEESCIYRAAFGLAEKGLEHFRRLGVASIELHHFSRDTAADRVVAAGTAVLRAGLRLAIHGYLADSSPAGEELYQLYPWLTSLIDVARGVQETLSVTVHALAADSGSIDRLRERTVQLLGTLSRQGADLDPSIRFALELNRDKGDADPSTTWEGVEEMCRQIDREDVGICWDWGHGCVNALNGSISLEPPAGFLDRVVNTHIHGLSPSGSTHWPLNGQGVPVERFASLLRNNGYRGLFVLELNPARFASSGSPGRLIEASIERLRKALGD